MQGPTGRRSLVQLLPAVFGLSHGHSWELVGAITRKKIQLAKYTSIFLTKHQSIVLIFQRSAFNIENEIAAKKFLTYFYGLGLMSLEPYESPNISKVATGSFSDLTVCYFQWKESLIAKKITSALSSSQKTTKLHDLIQLDANVLPNECKKKNENKTQQSLT